MANIYSVAKLARVSVATVSAVVNETAYVSPQLKRRVKAAIAKLGYQPNLVARSLAMRKSHTLGMIVPDIANPFWPEVVRGAEDRAHESGYTLVLSNSDDESRKEGLYLRLFHAKRVDGIILSKAPGKPNQELLGQLAAAHIPIVQVTRISLGNDHDSVVLNDRDAAYEAVSHLLRMGYRRIGMVGGLGEVTTTRRRLSGYRQALTDWKRPFEPRAGRQGGLPRRLGLRGRSRPPQERDRRCFHLQLPDGRRFREGASPVPAALPPTTSRS